MTNSIVKKSSRAIPQPPLHPLIGNLLAINPATPVQSMMGLAKVHGPLFRITLPGQEMILVNDVALATEVSDERRFGKIIHEVLSHLRDLAGDALFTAASDEPNWAKAHRILLPAFGPAAMRDTFDSMLDIASQLMTKWERLGENEVFDVADNMTRLTLDTIALCGFDYRFNSFYREQQHPFVDAMVRSLAESGARGRRLSIQNRLMLAAHRRFAADNAYMHGVCDEVIARRRQTMGEGAPRDLLNLMLGAVDPVTGETLDDVNIRYQLVTFLIAGHETTSGLLSFAVHALLEHPEVLARARAQVDDVIGTDMPRFEQMAQLGYLDQILRETLRLYPTVPAIGVAPKHDTTLGGYDVAKDQVILMLPPSIHRDPSVWSDPERFDPDRFDPAVRASIAPQAWMPFGSGDRSCIGRAFAMQEATLVLAMLLQRFEIARPAPYTLKIKETLTLKPDGLVITARRRHPPLSTKPRPSSSATLSSPSSSSSSSPASFSASVAAAGAPLLVLYGSNAGTAESFARRVASDAASRGYRVTCAALDTHVGALPTEGAVVVVSASYNGQPPDNARAFCEWARAWTPLSLTDVKAAVFGCGSRDWASTYQAIPALLDERLQHAGATTILPRGEADATSDFFGQCEQWLQQLWPALDTACGVQTSSSTAPLYDVGVVAVPGAELVAHNDLRFATVVANRELVDMTFAGARSRRHLELQLADDVSYVAGDALTVLPENHPDLVQRALRRFSLSDDAAVVVRTTRPCLTSTVPTNRPVSALELFRRHLELTTPATRTDLKVLAAHNHCPPHRDHLAKLAVDDVAFVAEILKRRVSVLDLLDRYTSTTLPLATFLELLPPTRVRRYSIASSPLVSPSSVALTVAVVDSPAWSGQGRYFGMASTYLARLQPGDRVAVGVRSTTTPFHPPHNNRAPMVLIAAGTGLAPFRGFLQERAARHAAGDVAGATHLFFGCDRDDVDLLYSDELFALRDAGLLTIHLAQSARPDVGSAGNDGDDDDDDTVIFVQHRLWRERELVLSLVDDGAFVFLCGDGRRMAPAARATLARILDRAGGGADSGRQRLGSLEQEGRYVADLFA